MMNHQTIRKRTEPAFIEPMQCKPVTALPTDEKWIFEIKFDGIFYVKDLDSRFIAVSRTLAEYHGRKDPAQMIGLTDRDLFSSEHAEGALADELEIIRTGIR
jgi:hypothetical protein